MKCKQCGKEYDVKETQRVNGDADWTNSLCCAACYTQWMLNPNKCECGNNKFVCRFKYHGDCVVDGNNNWQRDIRVDDSEFYGPYHCTKCSKEYQELPTN